MRQTPNPDHPWYGEKKLLGEHLQLIRSFITLIQKSPSVDIVCHFRHITLTILSLCQLRSNIYIYICDYMCAYKSWRIPRFIQKIWRLRTGNPHKPLQHWWLSCPGTVTKLSLSMNFGVFSTSGGSGSINSLYWGWSSHQKNRESL